MFKTPKSDECWSSSDSPVNMRNAQTLICMVPASRMRLRRLPRREGQTAPPKTLANNTVVTGLTSLKTFEVRYIITKVCNYTDPHPHLCTGFRAFLQPTTKHLVRPRLSSLVQHEPCTSAAAAVAATYAPPGHPSGRHPPTSTQASPSSNSPRHELHFQPHCRFRAWQGPSGWRLPRLGSAIHWARVCSERAHPLRLVREPRC